MSDPAAIPNIPEGDFGRFLRRLDADPNRAAEKYEQIRRRLIKFFVWNHSCRAEELVDRTLTTLEKKMQAEDIDNAFGYALGIARNVDRESFRESRRIKALEDEPGGQDSLVDSSAGQGGMLEDIDKPIRLACLQECRAKLPPADSMLVIEYYSADGEKNKDHRERLARRMGITMNALRVRANRLREKLEKCVSKCLDDRRRALAKAYGGGQS